MELPRPAARRGACAAGGDSPMAPSADSVLNCCIYDSPRAGRGRGAVRQGIGLPSRSLIRAQHIRGVVLGMRCRRDQERELQPAADKCCSLEGGKKGTLLLETRSLRELLPQHFCKRMVRLRAGSF